MAAEFANRTIMMMACVVKVLAFVCLSESGAWKGKSKEKERADKDFLQKKPEITPRSFNDRHHSTRNGQHSLCWQREKKKFEIHSANLEDSKWKSELGQS